MHTKDAATLAAMSFTSPEDVAGFTAVLRQCLANQDIVRNFDRLTGANLAMAGAPIEVAVDMTSGRTEGDVHRFAAFVHDAIWQRLASCTRAEISAQALSSPLA